MIKKPYNIIRTMIIRLYNRDRLIFAKYFENKWLLDQSIIKK